MDLFTSQDFKVFDIPGFSDRMNAIRGAIRPKLTSIGQALAPKVAILADRPLHVHVAKHARRTVNAPDDTWAALAPDSRGYKKDVHFKIAISRHCVRFLFEVGPEYYEKEKWLRGWNQEFAAIGPRLRSVKGLYWFKDEHDEDPTAELRSLSPADLKKLGEDLTRRRNGQLVFGRRLAAQDFTALNSKEVERIAISAFAPLALLFGLHKARKENRTVKIGARRTVNSGTVSNF